MRFKMYHENYNVLDLKRSMDFYEKALGLKEVRRKEAKDGSFTQETYDSLISLLAWLTDIYDLETEDILRHYDCGGKKCPLYYTEHPDAWERLKEDVANAIQ